MALYFYFFFVWLEVLQTGSKTIEYFQNPDNAKGISEIVDISIILEASPSEFFETLLTISKALQESGYSKEKFDSTEVLDCDNFLINTSVLTSTEISKFYLSYCKSLTLNQYLLSVSNDDIILAFKYIEKILGSEDKFSNVSEFYSINSRRLQCYGCICDIWGDCIECIAGFYFNNDYYECMPCPDQCSSCPNIFCDACIAGYYLNSDSQCLSCSSSCSSCSSETQCSSCVQNYYLNSNFQCISCPSPCVNCSSANNCVSCLSGYYLNSNSQCLSCVSPCLSCSTQTKCSSCITYYYLNSNFQCTPCPFPCLNCISANNCVSCLLGYYLNSNSQCLSCDTTCSSCSSQTNCFTCITNYYLNSNSQCKLCPFPCLTCYSANDCISCLSGYYLNSDSQCLSCDSTCSICSSQTNCSTCVQNYYLNSSFQCTQCPSTCLNCTSANNCVSCLSGYYLNSDSQCLSCDSTCSSCSSQTKCSTCVTNYYLNSSFQCTPCPSPCLNCLTSTKCITCLTGYTLNANYTCLSDSCDSFCNNCSLGNCLGCISDYVLNSNQICVVNTCDYVCSNCTYGICFQCPIGYWLSRGHCLNCNQNCLSCNNSETCVCIPNYVLRNNKCVTCQSPVVISSYIESDYSQFYVQFSSPFNQKISGCGFISSNDSFGAGFSCNLFQDTVNLVFGSNPFFSNESIFSIYMPALYSNLCVNSTIYLTVNYVVDPIPVYFTLSGVQTQSLNCNASELEFSASQIKGIYNNIAYFSWFANVTPTNSKVTSLVSSQTTSYLNIPLSLFNGLPSQITVSLHLSNSLKSNFVDYYTTQLSVNTGLTIALDVSSSISIYSSEDFSINAKVADFCGRVCKPDYNWRLTSSTYYKYDPSVFDFLDFSVLTLQKNTLMPGYFYDFEVVATCLDLNGTEKITIYADYSPLKLILDRTDSTIPRNFDLFIDGSHSYDPDGLGYLSFHWDCIQSNGQKCVSQSNILPNFTVISSNLVAGTLIVTLTITVDTSASTRSASKSLNFIIQDDLNSYISILFPLSKVEPSLTTVINSKIFTTSNVSLAWTQVQGYFFDMWSNNLPTLIIAPYQLFEGVYYQFTVYAHESKNSSSASVGFITNLAPVCVDNLSVSPPTGSSLSTLFKFFIDGCSDPDLDLPITYMFELLSENEMYIISQASQFNSIQTKLFEGSFQVFVKVCDQLQGCNYYNNSVVVAAFTNRVLYTKNSSIFSQYQSDTVNQALIPIMSVAYLNTFTMDNSDFTYIYQDVTNYLYSLPSLNSDSFNIFLCFASSVFNYNQQNLNFSSISAGLQIILNLFQISMIEIPHQVIFSLFNINEKILKFGNYSIEYINLVNSNLNKVYEIYSLDIIPGGIIEDFSSGNIQYYKSRLFASDLSNSSVLFDDGTNISIGLNPFTSNFIINSIFSVYSQPNGTASVVGIEFTCSGNYSNYTISMVDEKKIAINYPIQVFLPIQKNITGDCACLSYDGISLSESGCHVISVNKTGVLLSIEMNSLFQLVPFTSADKYYPAVIISGTLLLILVILFPILVLKSEKKVPQDSKGEINLYLSSFILLGISKKSSKAQIFERIVHYWTMINFCLMVEGAFYSSSSISLSKQSKLFIIGLISAVATIPFIVLAIFSNSFPKNRRSIILYFEIFTFCVCSSLIVYFSIICDSNTQNDWIISFGWAILLLIFFEVGVVSVLYLILKLKKNSEPNNDQTEKIYDLNDSRSKFASVSESLKNTEKHEKNNSQDDEENQNNNEIIMNEKNDKTQENFFDKETQNQRLYERKESFKSHHSEDPHNEVHEEEDEEFLKDNENKN